VEDYNISFDSGNRSINHSNKRTEQMLLSVHDRLILLAVIPLGAPQSGNAITMRIVHNLTMALAFTEEEYAEKQIVIDGDKASWIEGELKEVEIGPVARGIIERGLAAALPQWDKLEAMTVAHIQLFDKFNVSTELPETPESEEK